MSLSMFEILQQQFFEAYRTINESATKVIDLLNLKESYAKVLEEEIEEEIKKEFEEYDRSDNPYTVYPAFYDRSIIPSLEQDRLITAQKLLTRRIMTLKAKREPLTMRDVQLTHLTPFWHNWRPSVQMSETISTFKGVNSDNKCVITIPPCMVPESSIWDFRLEVEGKFDDTQLDTFTIEINGLRYDSYRRKLYNKIIYPVPHKKDKCQIILDFWMKNMNRSLFRNWYTTDIIITNVPDHLNIKLIVKNLHIDLQVAQIFRYKTYFDQVIVHNEKLIPPDTTEATFIPSTKIMITRYGFMTTNNEKIYDVISTIDGVEIDTMCGVYKLDVDDTVIWVDMICPIRADMLMIRLQRSRPAPVILIWEESNFILHMDGNMVLRFSPGERKTEN